MKNDCCRNIFHSRLRTAICDPLCPIWPNSPVKRKKHWNVPHPPLHILTGRTSEYRDSYIWREEELKHYAVKLPECTQGHAVKFLDGFAMKS